MTTPLLLDRYRLEGRLAVGGAGVVFAATDTRSEAPVVLKLFPPGAEPPLSGAWTREMRIAFRLEHPNIVPCIDAAYQGRGETSILVFPRVFGGSLRRELVKNGALPEKRVEELLRAISSALSFAHKHGIAHLDVKPENILFDGMRWVLTDFGSGRYMGSARRIPLTEGSEAYLPPESQTGQASYGYDQYALGLVGLEALEGRLPPSRLFWPRPPRNLAETGLRYVLERMAAPHPARRFGSINAAKACLESRPIDVLPIGQEDLLHCGTQVERVGQSARVVFRHPRSFRFCTLPGGPPMLQTQRRIVSLEGEPETIFASEQPIAVVVCSLEHQRALVVSAQNVGLVSIATGLYLSRWPAAQISLDLSDMALCFVSPTRLVGNVIGQPGLVEIFLEGDHLRMDEWPLEGVLVEVRLLEGRPTALLDLRDNRCLVVDLSRRSRQIVPAPPGAVWLHLEADRVTPNCVREVRT